MSDPQLRLPGCLGRGEGEGEEEGEEEQDEAGCVAGPADPAGQAGQRKPAAPLHIPRGV